MSLKGCSRLDWILSSITVFVHSVRFLRSLQSNFLPWTHTSIAYCVLQDKGQCNTSKYSILVSGCQVDIILLCITPLNIQYSLSFLRNLPIEMKTEECTE